jgi:hypothetical protein
VREEVAMKSEVTPSLIRQRGQLTSAAEWRTLNPEPQRVHLTI